jgi:membrane protein
LIYGAFATVPLFLLWIYVSWLIVLFGAELVCNLGVSVQWRKREMPKLLITLGVLRVFHERQQAGLKVRLRDIQRQGWHMAEHEWAEILSFLEQQRLVVAVEPGSWVLSRDLNQYSLQQLLNSSPWPLPRIENLPAAIDEPWYLPLRDALTVMHEQQANLFGEGLAVWLKPKEAVVDS